MWAFIRKEFFHIFRDYRSMVILFGMPVVMVLLFGFAITNDITNAKIGILDQSKDEVTREIIQKLVSSGYFLPEADLQSNKEIESYFKQGNIKAVVVFEPDFALKMSEQKGATVQIILDASEPNTASIISSYISGVINTYMTQKLVEQMKVPVAIQVQSRMMDNLELKSVYIFVPGVITI